MTNFTGMGSQRKKVWFVVDKKFVFKSPLLYYSFTRLLVPSFFPGADTRRLIRGLSFLCLLEVLIFFVGYRSARQELFFPCTL